MSTTLELLALPQDQAILEMIDDELDPSKASLDDLLISEGYLASANRCAYEVRPKTSKLSDSSWPYRGRAVVTHQRMDLGQLFDGLQMRVKVDSTDGTVNTHTNVIVGILSNQLGVHFDPQDYYSDAIVSPGIADYTLKATPTSLRWSGQVDIQIYPTL